MNLTWKEVYTRANILPSTATSQRERFVEFFSYSGKGRQRRYNDESVEVLTLIASMYSDSKDFETIREELERRFFVPTSITTTTNDEPTTIQPSLLELEQIITQAVSKAQQPLIEQNEAMRKEIAALHNDMNTIEKRQVERETVHYDLVDERLKELSLEAKKGFWAKLFGK